MKKQLTTFALSTLAIAVLSGCSSTGSYQNDDVTNSAQYRALEQELASLKNSSGSDSARASELEAELARLNSSNSTSSLLPPNPKPGECYARVVIPAKYKAETETVQTRAESQRIETSQPEFRWVEERVMVKEASERLEIVPATYTTVTETIQVSDATEQLVRVPAKYKTVTERILVRPAHTEWKKGTGPIQRVDAATGEIMCLVEVPAEYKTVTKSVVRTPAQTRVIEIPAEYKTVTKRKLVKKGNFSEWKEVLCPVKVNEFSISKIQRALKDAGYDPGPIDGVLGSQTRAALIKFQKANNLPQGRLDIETLTKLGAN